MMQHQYSSIISQALSGLPDCIDWITRDQALELLQISDCQLRRDTSLLSKLSLSNWLYHPYDKGFDRATFDYLLQFRQLVRRCGRAHAVNQLLSTNKSA